jgi:uncharacterized repeat protein (TIGR03803 family)
MTRRVCFALSQIEQVNTWKRFSLTAALLISLFAASLPAHSQTFTDLVNFNYTDGAIPFGLIQGTDANLYGVTNKGGNGANNGCNVSCGSIFKMTPTGKLTSVFGFDGTNGNGPSGMVQATNGAFYGTASYGGTGDCTSYGSSGGCGAIFKLVGTTQTPLYDFCPTTSCTTGAIPAGGLVQGTDGNFYGTTAAGGTGTCSDPIGPGCGTVFKITPTGTLTVLHSFTSTDGSFPYGRLIQATNGSFYGTTSEGGTNGYGTIFKITSSGTLTSLHSFSATGGAYPYGGLVQAANGDFYGMTTEILLDDGAPNCSGTGVGYGTFYQMTSSNTVTTVFTFNKTDGAYPFDSPTLGSDGNFYGTTACGGSSNVGVAFELTPGGSQTPLHTFSGSDGTAPYSGLTQNTNGTFYGTTVIGGTDNDGTVFSIATGLPAFIITRPTSGKVGATVYILGNSLKGATAVTFNGTAATSFTVVSGTEIKATVPTGATTGPVVVTTSSGTLTSNVAFRIP